MENRLLAQVQSIPIGSPISGIGPLGLENQPATNALTRFTEFVSTFIGILTVAAILWFLLQFFLGAFAWINAGGDSKALEAARSKLITATVGLVIVFTALILVNVLGNIFGLDILKLGDMIDSLKAR